MAVLWIKINEGPWILGVCRFFYLGWPGKTSLVGGQEENGQSLQSEGDEEPGLLCSMLSWAPDADVG